MFLKEDRKAMNYASRYKKNETLQSAQKVVLGTISNNDTKTITLRLLFSQTPLRNSIVMATLFCPAAQNRVKQYKISVNTLTSPGSTIPTDPGRKTPAARS